MRADDKKMTKAEKRILKKSLLDAINYFDGTVIGLAKAMGVSRGLIHHWLNERVAVPLKRAFQIEKITYGTVKAKNLVKWFPPGSN